MYRWAVAVRWYDKLQHWKKKKYVKSTIYHTVILLQSLNVLYPRLHTHTHTYKHTRDVDTRARTVHSSTIPPLWVNYKIVIVINRLKKDLVKTMLFSCIKIYTRNICSSMILYVRVLYIYKYKNCLRRIIKKLKESIFFQRCCSVQILSIRPRTFYNPFHLRPYVYDQLTPTNNVVNNPIFLLVIPAGLSRTNGGILY